MKHLFKFIITLFIFLIGAQLYAQKVSVERIDPPFWWAGMKNPKLQLMVYGNNISDTEPIIEYDGVQLKEIIKVESPNYLFLDIVIDENAKPGTFNIAFTKGKKTKASYSYMLKARDSNPNLHKGFDNSDVIYLLMPDRFSNGNPDNDDMPDMLEKANRAKPLGRHGGDIAGIDNKLEYLADLGITAMWINPLLENNLPTQSYHGYAVTDLYKIDSRYGSNDDYVKLVENAHSKGIKVIMDMIFNHLGTGYYWQDDLCAWNREPYL